MRKIVIFIFIFKISVSNGQDNPCVNEVSTNPNAPTNLNLPADNHPDVDYGALFLNEFDWIPFRPSGGLRDLTTIGLEHLGNSQHMFPLYNPSLGHSSYYQYIRDELIMPTGGEGGVIPNHKEGWELIGVNLGFFPNGVVYSDIDGESNQYPRIPYVILYHRYSSKIRVFANIGDEWAEKNAYQAVRIRLSHNVSNQKLYNGIFRLQEGLDRTLDQPTVVSSVGALAEAPNDKQRWFSADFTVAFDPCVCEHPSAFNLDFELIKNIDLQLYGRGIEVAEDIVDADGKFVTSDFLSGFEVDFDDKDKVSGGFVMYKKMEDLFKDYIKKMEAYEKELEEVEQHNKQVKRNLAIVKFTELAVRVGVAIATGGGAEASAAKVKLAADAPDMIDGNNINWKKVVKEAEKILGKEIATFISGNFKTKEKPSVPNKPTANFSEMYFNGRLQQVDPKPGPTIYTPGTYGNSITEDIIDQHHFPVYNEALGVFALLEKPKIQISYTKERLDCYEEPIGQSGIYQKITENNLLFQFKLSEPLKYILNPVLKIKEKEILASFKFDNELDKDYLNRSNNYVNVESIDFDFNEAISMPNFFSLNTPYLEIDAMNSFIGQYGYVVKVQVPQNLNCQDWLNGTPSKPVNPSPIKDIYLKLLINVTYEGNKSDGSPHEYTYMFTYKVDDIDYVDEPIYPNLPGSAGDFTQYPENLYINGASFDGSNVDGCRLQGNTYLCKAWNDVDLAGSLFIADNYNVTIHAGNEVTFNSDDFETVFESNGENAGEFNFIVEPVLDYSSPMPPQTPGQVSQFCKNTNRYKANSRPATQGMRLADDEDTLAIDGRMEELAALEEDTSREEEEDVFMQEEFNVDIQLFPNPTSGNTKLRIGVSESTLLSVQITDLSGKQLSSPFNQKSLSVGTNELSLATNNLAAGTYLVHIIVGDQQQVVRLLKQ